MNRTKAQRMRAELARQGIGTRMTLSKDQIGTELAALIASGMPEQVAIGFLVAKAVEPKWAEARQIIDDLGEQVHQGDPLKKSRIDHFNDLLIQKMREQERERRA